jgi:hypothetical protein
MTSMSVRLLSGSPIQVARQFAAKASRSPKVLVGVTCLLLGISGGVRFWREWRFHSLAQANANCPFLLDDLPKRLGSWQTRADKETQLDPEVARFAGSQSHILRTYVHDQSNEQVSVLILYGLAIKVNGHTPEICYPSAGYRLAAGPEDTQFLTPGSTTPETFRSAIYSRKTGPIAEYSEACYTFLYHGKWTPDLSAQWKLFRYYPGVFKIQVQGPATGLDLKDESPAEALLKELVQAIDARISLVSAPATPGATPAQAARAPQGVGMN